MTAICVRGILVASILGFCLTPAGAAIAAPHARPARTPAPKQYEQIQIAAFDFYLKQFNDAGPQYLSVAAHRGCYDPSGPVIESIHRFFTAAKKQSQMGTDARNILKHHPRQTAPIIYPGVSISMTQMRRNGPDRADVTMYSKYNPMGDSDYGAGEEVLLHLVRSRGQWSVMSKQQLSEAG
ncbi:hypothetical protein CCAX7_43950 [Capsulimonas corticalis]|uniref:Uncharacterized protein n=1 Tax=Capsulimonas corticalis TaxID=2219043 RepID=A0A402CXG1_9BACT|nr:hypothetical protein [Capsulimonas corticalis]BDI32344.1 hypothetical protein CCAX7_43950 [Capsulimonas corticalis]